MIKDIKFELGFESVSPLEHDKRVNEINEFVDKYSLEDIKDLERQVKELEDSNYEMRTVIIEAFHSLSSGDSEKALKILDDVKL